eukprot:3407770-Amphidinium_carterae.1
MRGTGCLLDLPPTSPGSLLSSLRFAEGIFGLSGAMVAASSTRVRGLALEKLQGKRATKHGVVLLVPELIALENALFDEHSIVSKVCLGLLLMMLYARIRLNDLRSAAVLDFDMDKDGRMCCPETKSRNFKTANVVGMSG